MTLREALAVYMELREKAIEFDEREGDCTCDIDNFHRCEFCAERSHNDAAIRSHMDLFGERFAVALANLTNAIQAVTQ